MASSTNHRQLQANTNILIIDTMSSPDLIEGLEMFGMIDLVLFEGSATRYGAASVVARSLEPTKAMGQLVKYFYTASLYRVQACLLYDQDFPWLLFWSLPASPDFENLMICQYTQVLCTLSKKYSCAVLCGQSQVYFLISLSSYASSFFFL